MTPLFLSVETSTTNCSVALFQREDLISVKDLNDGYSHSENLAQSIKEMVSMANVPLSQLSAIGVGVGPGSYTGLRIGVSLVKGLAYSLNIPVVSFSSTHILFEAIRKNVDTVNNSLFIPMIDARRMEVFCQLFDSTGKMVSDIRAEILHAESFQEEATKFSRIYFGGPGSEKFTSFHLDNRFEWVKDLYPSAQYSGEIILEKFENQQFEDVAYFEPKYLKEFLAGKPKKGFLQP